MTSVLRAPGQIYATSHFLIATYGNTTTQTYGYYPVCIEDGLYKAELAGRTFTRVGNTIDMPNAAEFKVVYQLIYNANGKFNTESTWINIFKGDLFRDQGQFINFSINGLLQIQWRLCQMITPWNPDTPGNHSQPPEPHNMIYVITYNADYSLIDEPEPVCVARI